MSAQGSSLLVGDRLVSRCEDGLLEAEYALFDRSEVLVTPGAREDGYMTTAGLARVRLAKAHVTVDLAQEAFSALRDRHLRPLARSAAVRSIVDQLGPYEAFQGGRFVAGRGRYTGVWLDLDALATACPLRDAAILFQVLHLVMVLEEVGAETPVRVLTSATGGDSAMAGRTWRRVDLEATQRLPWILREMKAPSPSHVAARDEAEVREEILRDLHARAGAAAVPSPRLQALAATIARTGSTPPAPPAPEARPSTSGASARPPPGALDVPPAENGASDVATMLRRANELLRGPESLLRVAEAVATLAEQSRFHPEVTLLSARAWLAAGETSAARTSARRVVDDVSATDEIRILALEILNATPRSPDSARPTALVPVRTQPLATVSSPAVGGLIVRGSDPPPSGPPLDERPALDPRLVLLLEPNSQRAAGYRLLRDHLLAKAAPRVIAVASGEVNEGKTTCAVNLAMALSEKAGARVLLVEANFFAPTLADVFSVDASTPLEPERNPAPLSPYRVVRLMRGFHVAALLPRRGEPLPFNGRWFDMAIERLSSSDYDHIIIDTAALDGSPVTTEVLSVAHGVLLTARAETSTARALRRAAEQIPEGRGLGVALIDSDS